MINKTNEKACCFYVSKNHLLVILMSYLKSNLKRNKKLNVFMEDDFEIEKKKVLEKVDLENNIKEKILNIEWNNNRSDKLLNDKLKGIVIIQGSIEYIREINNRLKNNMKIKIINCYKFTDFEINSREILENHGNIVNTKGEYKISDIFNKKIVKNPVLTK